MVMHLIWWDLSILGILLVIIVILMRLEDSMRLREDSLAGLGVVAICFVRARITIFFRIIQDIFSTKLESFWLTTVGLAKATLNVLSILLSMDISAL